MEKTDTAGTTPNRKYKDSVFTALFSSKESLLELYQVLHPEDTEVTINDIEKIALENVLLIRRYNDAAMGVRDKLIILSEHQSTINPNMPECGDYMHLTDAYPKEYKNNLFLQLSIKVIKNGDKDNILGGYIAFVKKAEKLRNTQGYTFTDALKEAVQWCREENILADFMKERSEELMSLMLEEWNMEDALKYSRQEGRQEGMVYAYYEMNLQTNEIAKKLNLTEAEVLEIIGKKDIQ